MDVDGLIYGDVGRLVGKRSALIPREVKLMLRFGQEPCRMIIAIPHFADPSHPGPLLLS